MTIKRRIQNAARHVIHIGPTHVVFHALHPDTQTHARPRIPRTQTLNTLSTGRITTATAYAIIAAAAIGTATQSAGAYTASQGDYGQIVSNLQQIATQEGNNGATQNKILTDVAPLNGDLYDNTDQVPYLQELRNQLGPITPVGSLYHVGSYLGNGSYSYLQWVYNGTTWAGETTTPGYEPVFLDQNRDSVFESPNGNSYLDWYPYAASGQNLETTGAPNWKTALDTANTPYSIFKDRLGASVFQDLQGNSYFSEDIPFPHVANQFEITSAFTTFNSGGSGETQSVFQNEQYNTATGTNYGKTEDSSGYPMNMESVFTAGTGPDSGAGASNTGSVFTTDDTTNKNVGNSVFLDPYGNSYLDDITNALTLPAQMDPQNYIESGSQNQPIWSYTNTGNLSFWLPNNGGANSTNDNQPLTLTELIALALGTAPNANYGKSTNGTQYYSQSYPWLSAEAQQIPSGMTNATWYNSQSSTGWSNAFAYAMFNPPSGATAPSGLTPFLSALQGWNDSNTFQNNLSNAQGTIGPAINTASTTMNTWVQGQFASGTPTASNPGTGLTGGQTGTYFPIQQISQSFGQLTTVAQNGPSYSDLSGSNSSIAVTNAIEALVQLEPSDAQQPAGVLANTDGDTNLTPLTPVNSSSFQAGGSFLTPTTQPSTPGQTTTATMDATDSVIQAFITGFVDGMMWFRAEFGWMAQIMGWLLELFTLVKCWELLVWGVQGGKLPIDINLKRPTPKHDSVAEGDGRNSPLNTAQNFGNVQQETSNTHDPLPMIDTTMREIGTMALNAATTTAETAAEVAPEVMV